MDCVFCAIAAGDIPSATLYEDDDVYAFLDIGPLKKGHALVIPRAHAAKLEEMPATTAGALLQTAQRLLPALRQVTGDPDATLAIHDGPGAGQEVPHVHLHIVPRRSGDGGGPIHALFSQRAAMSMDNIQELAGVVRGQLVAP